MELRRKQVLALLGSVSLLLTSCSGGRVAYADEIAAQETEMSIELTEAAQAETGKDQQDAPETEKVPQASEESTDAETGSEPVPGETEEPATETVKKEETETGTEAPKEKIEEAVTESPVEIPTETGTESSGPPAEKQTEGSSAEGETESETKPAEEAAEEITEKDTVSITEPEDEDSTEQGTERPAEDLTSRQEPEDTTEPEEKAEELLQREETEDLSETETEETEELPEEETEEETEEVSEEEAGPYEYGNYSGSTSSGSCYWDDSWFIKSGFRFTQVDKEYALISSGSGTFVYEKPEDGARKIGEIPFGGVVCILKDVDDAFFYVESGGIRGFVPRNVLSTGEAAQKIVDAVGEEALTQGDLLCEKADNEAFTFTKTTSYPVVAGKVYAMALTSSFVYEYADTSSRFVGDVSSGSLVYLLADAGNGWYFVESGDVRGFVPACMLLAGEGAAGIVSDLGEENAPLAEQLLDPEENRSVYYTLLSVESAENEIGSDICRTAVGFVGKLPYVYGGTSLTGGADCSGFVQSVFAGYGIYLPRTAQEQGANGQAVLSLADAQPGDVVYYASGPHVGIYIGNGKVVQCSGREYNTAANPGKGPTISNADYMPVTSIRRYLIVQEDNAADGGYRTDDTPYTQEQLEMIWAIVAQEDNGSYDGALAVISSAMNRTESGAWSYEGSNALSQLTAAGQYCYSLDNYWVPRLNGNVPDYVKTAVYDCLKRGIRNHGYTSFRSTRGKTTGSGAVQIGGNWYFGT